MADAALCLSLAHHMEPATNVKEIRVYNLVLQQSFANSVSIGTQPRSYYGERTSVASNRNERIHAQIAIDRSICIRCQHESSDLRSLRSRSRRSDLGSQPEDCSVCSVFTSKIIDCLRQCTLVPSLPTRSPPLLVIILLLLEYSRLSLISHVSRRRLLFYCSITLRCIIHSSGYDNTVFLLNVLAEVSIATNYLILLDLFLA